MEPGMRTGIPLGKACFSPGDYLPGPGSDDLSKNLVRLDFSGSFHCEVPLHPTYWAGSLGPVRGSAGVSSFLLSPLLQPTPPHSWLE